MKVVIKVEVREVGIAEKITQEFVDSFKDYGVRKNQGQMHNDAISKSETKIVKKARELDLYVEKKDKGILFKEPGVKKKSEIIKIIDKIIEHQRYLLSEYNYSEELISAKIDLSTYLTHLKTSILNIV